MHEEILILRISVALSIYCPIPVLKGKHAHIGWANFIRGLSGMGGYSRGVSVNAYVWSHEFSCRSYCILGREQVLSSSIQQIMSSLSEM